MIDKTASSFSGQWQPYSEEAVFIKKIKSLAQAFFDKKEVSIRLLSWNIGTQRDFANMAYIKNKLAKGHSLAEAFSDLIKETLPDPTEDELKSRLALIRQVIEKQGHLDLLCLQESWQIKNLKDILPETFSFFIYKNKDGYDGAVCWKKDDFRFLSHADLDYQQAMPEALDAAPDTLVLLQHIPSNAKICVVSSHLRGFSLSSAQALGGQNQKKAVDGDNQAIYNLNTLNKIPADLFVYAGDVNTTRDIYTKRLALLHQAGYVTDEDDKAPTIYDASLKESDQKTPKAVKLDYVFIRPGAVENASVQTQAATPIQDFSLRPSDHVPVMASLRFKI
jgi:exonuclease III